MTRRQLFKNLGFGLAGILALPLFGKPGKASEPVLPMTDYNGNSWPTAVEMTAQQAAAIDRYTAMPRKSSGEFAMTQNIWCEDAPMTAEAWQQLRQGHVVGIGYEVV